MRLIFLGKELDATKEQELISEEEFGYKVTVKYNDGEDIFYNCTEVHHLYNYTERSRLSIAFESDIHGTGVIRKTIDIESVNIEIANKIFDNF